MSAETIWHFLHIGAILLMAGGLGATMAPVYRAWRSKDTAYQMASFRQAADNETGLLLPGALLTGATGAVWGAVGDWNFFTDGWLLALWLTYLLATFVCLPLLGLGLRRARLLSLQSAKSGAVTPELEAALNDNVPLVFGTIIIVLMAVMTWLPIFKPF